MKRSIDVLTAAFGKPKTDIFRDVVAMDTGTYTVNGHIGIDTFNRFLLQKITENTLNLAYVANAKEHQNQILWFDIDITHETDVTIDQILDSITHVLCRRYKIKNTELNDRLVLTMSHIETKYHVYFIDIFENRQCRKKIWTAVTAHFNNKHRSNVEVIDMNATNLRYDGFNKYHTGKRYFIENSRYKILKPSAWTYADFYKNINLLYFHDVNGVKYRKDTEAIIEIQDKNDEQKENESQDIDHSLTDDIFNAFVSKYRDAISGYKIKEIYYHHEEQELTLYCEDDQLCPFSQQNTTEHIVWMIFSFKTKQMVLHCNHTECEGEILKMNLSRMDCRRQTEETHHVDVIGEVDIINDSEDMDEDVKMSESDDDDKESDDDDKENEDIEYPIYPISKKIKEDIEVRYGFIKHILLGFDIVKIKRFTQSKSITFCCSDKQHSRRCPFVERYHSKSNHYLVYNPRKGILQQKCHSHQCRGKVKVLWMRDRTTDLPKPFDTDLATLFMKLYPLSVVYSESDPSYKGFYHRSTNYWVYDKGHRKISRIIQKDFIQYIEGAYAREIDKCSEDDLINSLNADLKSIRAICKMYSKYQNVIKCLSNWLNTEDIEWNSNPYRVVFPNGVLNVETGYFGPSDPEEYINNNRVMGCNWEPEDHGFIQTELLDNLFNRIFPIEAHRDCWLTFASIAFEGCNYRKCVINHGVCGRNGKSKTCEMLVYTFGDYANMGDVKTLLRGKKDKASLANLNEKRFILYEEPDDTKAMDIAMIKMLVGGIERMCARQLYATTDQIKLHNKMMINVNNLPGLCADQATLDRICVFKWATRFVDDPSEVDESKRIFLCDKKYASPIWWKKAAPQLVHLLLRFYKIFVANNRCLQIPRSIQSYSRKFCEGNDAFMRWFEENFELLPMDETNKKIFITKAELCTAFDQYPERDKILPNNGKYTVVSHYIAKAFQDRPALSKRFNKKITNWRISADERKKYKNISRQSCIAAQYAGPGLIACRRRLVPITIEYNYDMDEDVKEAEESLKQKTITDVKKETIKSLISDINKNRINNCELFELYETLQRRLSKPIERNRLRIPDEESNSNIACDTDEIMRTPSRSVVERSLNNDHNKNMILSSQSVIPSTDTEVNDIDVFTPNVSDNTNRNRRKRKRWDMKKQNQITDYLATPTNTDNIPPSKRRKK